MAKDSIIDSVDMGTVREIQMRENRIGSSLINLNVSSSNTGIPGIVVLKFIPIAHAPVGTDARGILQFAKNGTVYFRLEYLCKEICKNPGGCGCFTYPPKAWAAIPDEWSELSGSG